MFQSFAVPFQVYQPPFTAFATNQTTDPAQALQATQIASLLPIEPDQATDLLTDQASLYETHLSTDQGANQMRVNESSHNISSQLDTTSIYNTLRMLDYIVSIVTHTHKFSLASSYSQRQVNNSDHGKCSTGSRLCGGSRQQK